MTNPDENGGEMNEGILCDIVAEPSAGDAQQRPAKGSAPDQWFTVVFPGSVAAYPGNPHLADTPFGRAQAIEAGDKLAEFDALSDINNDLVCICLDLINALEGGSIVRSPDYESDDAAWLLTAAKAAVAKASTPPSGDQ